MITGLIIAVWTLRQVSPDWADAPRSRFVLTKSDYFRLSDLQQRAKKRTDEEDWCMSVEEPETWVEGDDKPQSALNFEIDKGAWDWDFSVALLCIAGFLCQHLICITFFILFSITDCLSVSETYASGELKDGAVM
jgi:hypothetical protein